VKPTPRVSLSCTIIIRWDGADPLEPPEPSENDYHRNFETAWREFEERLRRVGVRALDGPPYGWWNVAAMFVFRPEDMPLVAAVLKECAYQVLVCGSDVGR
jgi:hypothetical protein